MYRGVTFRSNRFTSLLTKRRKCLNPLLTPSSIGIVLSISLTKILNLLNKDKRQSNYFNSLIYSTVFSKRLVKSLWEQTNDFTYVCSTITWEGTVNPIFKKFCRLANINFKLKYEESRLRVCRGRFTKDFTNRCKPLVFTTNLVVSVDNRYNSGPIMNINHNSIMQYHQFSLRH